MEGKQEEERNKRKVRRLGLHLGPQEQNAQEIREDRREERSTEDLGLRGGRRGRKWAPGGQAERVCWRAEVRGL